MVDETRNSTDEIYERFFMRSPDMLCIVRLDGVIEEVNPTFAQTLGVPQEEAIGTELRELLHPQDEPTSLELFAGLSEGSPPSSMECRVRCQDGDYHWFSWNLQVCFESRLVFADARVCSEPSHAEIGPSERSGYSQALLESIDDSYCVVEVLFDDADVAVDYRFLVANSAFGKRTGLSGVTGRTIRSLVPGHEQDWFDAFGRIALTGEPERFQGSVLGRYYDVYALRVGDPKQRRVAVLLRDITEHKRAEDALRASEERFRRALEIESVGVIFFDLDGRITHANDAFMKMGDYSTEDLEAGRLRWDELTPPEWVPASLNAIRELEKSGYTTPYEKEYYRPDGSRWWALFAARSMDDESAMEYVIEITDRKRIEEERLRALADAEMALKARDEFLSIASHELRSPVASVKVAIQMIRRAAESGRLDDERLARYTRTIEDTADHLTVLIDDLLNVSRLQSGQLPIHPEPTNLAQLVSDVIQTQYAIEERYRLCLELAAAENLLLNLDPGRIRQVVVNLLDNALKYSPEGGEVNIALSHDQEGVSLQVRDQGIGMESHSLESVFEPFGRAANASESQIPGMGLGLYICRRIAEAHGGKLWAESEGQGQGTTVCLWLPR